MGATPPRILTHTQRPPLFRDLPTHARLGAGKHERDLHKTRLATAYVGRFFANGNESCPKGALLRKGGPRADKPARDKPVSPSAR